MFLLRYFLLLLVFLSTSNSRAATALPKNLNQADRVRALQILGLGSAPKLLDNPYPLGGYSGVEIGLSSEFISLQDLASLGSRTSDNGELSFYNFSLGKGLYYNVDTFIYFTPYLQSEKIQFYGGQLRWGFYESPHFPLTFSASFYFGGANFSNLINVTTVGADIIATVNMENVAVYFGGGRVRAVGKFSGGADGVTNTGETEGQDILESHTVFGLNVDISKAFLAFEVDRYLDSNYSAKLGYRF
ncbi:MAG: hypothetical protein ACXVCP_06210 [Bdellovibrio sp.]